MPRGAQALPSAALPPASARPRHARPTHQRSMSPAKERVPVPNSASGERGKVPSRGQVARPPAWGDPPGSVGFPSFLPPWNVLVLVSPNLGFHLYGRGFFGDGTLSFTPRFTCLLWLRGRGARLGTPRAVVWNRQAHTISVH